MFLPAVYLVKALPANPPVSFRLLYIHIDYPRRYHLSISTLQLCRTFTNPPPSTSDFYVTRFVFAHSSFLRIDVYLAGCACFTNNHYSVVVSCLLFPLRSQWCCLCYIPGIRIPMVCLGAERYTWCEHIYFKVLLFLSWCLMVLCFVYSMKKEAALP